MAIQFAVNGACFASFLPRLPELRDHIGGTTAGIGLLLTVTSATGLAASATLSRVIGRFGTRNVLLVGGLLVAASLALLGAAGGWPSAALAMAGLFFFDVFVDVAMNMQGSWLSARRARPIMNRLHGLWSLGAVVGGLVAARAADAGVSLSTHLWTTSALIAAASTVIAFQLLPVDEVHGGTAEPGEPILATRRVPRGAFFVAGLTAVMIETAAISWAAFRLTDDLSAGAAVGALAYVAVAGGMTVGRFVGDHLMHRFGSARVVVACTVTAVVGLTSASLLNVGAVALAGFLVAGFGMSTMTPRLYDLAARANGSGAGLGVLTAGMRTSTIMAPAAIAFIATQAFVGAAIAAVALACGTGFLLVLPALNASADRAAERRAPAPVA